MDQFDFVSTKICLKDFSMVQEGEELRKRGVVQ